MFPFRRGNGGGKKRRGNNRNGNPNANNGGRRVPGSAGEVLSQLQPTTKAVAQVLAGNAKISGQVTHARNILRQADQLVEERTVERLPPAMREQFLEQLALLKLTLADVEAFEQEIEDEEADETPAPEPVPMERLRALARSLAEPVPEPEVVEPTSEVMAEPDPVSPPPAPAKPVAPAPTADANTPRQRRPGETLRLKSTRTAASDEPPAKHESASAR